MVNASFRVYEGQQNIRTFDRTVWKQEAYYRLISCNICIRSNEREIFKKFRQLYAYYSSSLPLPDCETYYLREGRYRGRRFFQLITSNKVIFQTINPIEILPFLEWYILDSLVPKLSRYITFHAAALSKDGVGIIFPANTGLGKTTISCALIMHGFRYFTDDITTIDTKTFCLLPLPRGLVIHEKTFYLLHSFNMPLPQMEFYMRHAQKDYWYFNPSSHIPTSTDQAVPVKYIVFLEEVCSLKENKLEKIPKAKAVAQLLNSKFSNGCLSKDIMIKVMEFVEGVDCYALSGQNLRGRVNSVLRLLDQ